MDTENKQAENNVDEAVTENSAIHYMNLMHESDMARLSRTNELLMKANKRLHVQIIAELAVIMAMIIAFFVYESQWDKEFETITQTVEQDTEAGNNNFVGGDYIGTTGSENNDSALLKEKENR